MTELPQKRQARIERMEKQKGQRATTSAYGSLPWRRPRRAGKFHRLMAGMGTAGGRNSTRAGKSGARTVTIVADAVKRKRRQVNVGRDAYACLSAASPTCTPRD